MENKSAKILAVDDSTTNIILLEGILQEIGYQTETAPNAKDALRMIKNDPPDLVLLDLMMPRISGYKLLEKIKNTEGMKQIPVVIISAKTDAKSIKMAMDLGAADYIKKPIDIQNFITRLENILKAQIRTKNA
jgi:PleD family two-component response regulator